MDFLPSFSASPRPSLSRVTRLLRRAVEAGTLLRRLVAVGAGPVGNRFPWQGQGQGFEYTYVKQTAVWQGFKMDKPVYLKEFMGEKITRRLVGPYKPIIYIYI